MIKDRNGQRHKWMEVFHQWNWNCLNSNDIFKSSQIYSSFSHHGKYIFVMLLYRIKMLLVFNLKVFTSCSWDKTKNHDFLQHTITSDPFVVAIKLLGICSFPNCSLKTRALTHSAISLLIIQYLHKTFTKLSKLG